MIKRRRDLLLDGDLLLLGLRRNHFHRLLENHHQALRLAVGLHQARLNARDVENVVDQPAQAIGFVVNHLIELMLRLLIGCLAVDEHLDIGLDAGQRRAQLVRDVGDEVVLHLRHFLLLGHVVQHAHHAGRLFIARIHIRQSHLECPLASRPFDAKLHDPPAGFRVALAHFLDQRNHLGIVDHLRDGEAGGGVDVEVEGSGRGVVGQHELVKSIGDQHGIADAVDDRLGMLPLGGGDAKLDVKLLDAQLSAGNRALGVLDECVKRIDQGIKIGMRAADLAKAPVLSRLDQCLG